MASDEEMLSLELGTLCKRYPDVSHEQILCLLLLRADLPRWGTKQQIDIAMLYHVEDREFLTLVFAHIYSIIVTL